MNDKRFNLDSLDAGRQRWSASIEDMNRSLEDLEQRLERKNEPGPEPRNQADEPQTRLQMPPARTSPDRPYQSLARDPNRINPEEPAIASKVTAELKELRDELRHQMNSDLRREFDSLRKEMTLASPGRVSTRAASELSAEFERLSDAIQALSDRSDDRNTTMLRLELEQVKAGLETLAREETVRSVDRRWDEFDRRWNEFETRVSPREPGEEGAASLAAIGTSLDQINTAVRHLPDSLSLRSLEEKVRILAVAIDHFARQKDPRSQDALAQIEERLDEISRAIVASAVSAQPLHFDPQPFERIEARISSLARQVEELIEDRPNAEVLERLNHLSLRIDEVAARADLPEPAVERLTGQLAIISEKLDIAPAAQFAEQLLQGIEQRFDQLADMFDRRQSDATEDGRALFRDIERRLDEVAHRVTGGAANDEAIRGLEAQIAELSALLTRPGPTAPAYEDIGPRLDDIEKSIAGNRNAILDAARQAADEAVRSFAGSNSDAVAVAALADDLKALDLLTRRSEERNSRTFEAIHDTLLKIVDRLGSFETAAAQPELTSKLTLGSAPSIETADADPAPDEAPDGQPTQERSSRDAAPRTPAQAAAEAAVAALSTDRAAETAAGSRVRSMLGGLSRAFGGARKESEEPPATEPAAIADEMPEPEIDLDAPLDPKFVNRPLEPGSGAPDLNAIMRRVRDERSQPSKAADMDAAKSDFIAAARRAAQAAAAEAEILKRTSELKANPNRLQLGPLFRAKRKTILLSATAIMLAFAGFQLGKSFLLDDKEVTNKDAAQHDAKAEEPTVQVTREANAEAAAPGTSEPQLRIAEGADKAPADIAEPHSHDASNAQPVQPDTAANSASGPTEASIVTEIAVPQPQIAGDAGSVHPVETADTPPAGFAPSSAGPATSIPAEAGPVPLREAAEAGDARAMFEIGSRYANGRGVKADMQKAAEWYEKAAALGFAPAQYRTGNLYEKGIGVTRDVKKAQDWYRQAAAQGNAGAMHNLAVLLAMGADGVPDNDAAAHWFLQAAELGITDSQFNLGILAAKGVGVPQDLEESYKWFALVAKTGDSDAAAKRDEIAKALQPQQIERARAAADLWKAKAADAAANMVEVPEAWLESTATTASVGAKTVVENIQRVLNAKGYDAGGPDGVMGAKTTAAIAAYQTASGMEATGEIDEKLVRSLLQQR